ncbi:unnamed protein product [Sphagnum jensenii]|uniref:Uncharacterized protein n=1 Tax=Sphagnum jensenii TaxID=128206 RepID=A0ABP1AXY1_9BRYO
MLIPRPETKTDTKAKASFERRNPRPLLERSGAAAVGDASNFQLSPTLSHVSHRTRNHCKENPEHPRAKKSAPLLKILLQSKGSNFAEKTFAG